MKFIVVLASLVASFVVLTGCSTCGQPTCQKEPAPCQTDLKGEVGK